MKTLTYTIPHNLGRLHDELLVACSELRPIQIEGAEFLESVMGVEGTDTIVRLIVADDANEVAIQAVIDAHERE
jgi:hypothetical protein